MKTTDLSHISMVRDRFSKILELWSILTDWDREHVFWINQPVLEINLDEVATKVANYKKKVSKLYELFREQKSISRLCSINLSAINNFDTNYLELMNTLLHESFKERHWKELLLEVYRGFEAPKLEVLTFKNLIDKKIRSFKSLITILAEKAQNQYIVEFKIDDIQRSMCSTHLVIRSIDRAGQLVISNVQSVRASFIEHRSRCDHMMISSEHLDTFLEQIFRVKRRIDILEQAYEMIIEMQDLLCHLRVLKFSPSLTQEIEQKDHQAVQGLFLVYHNLLDDMRNRGFSDLMKQIVDYEEKLLEQEEKMIETQPLAKADPENSDSGSNSLSGVSHHKDSAPPKLVLPPSPVQQQPPVASVSLKQLWRLGEAIAPHASALALLRRTVGTLEQYPQKLARQQSRWLHVSLDKLCDMCFAALQGTTDLEAFFPEVAVFLTDKTPLCERIVAAKSGVGDVLFLEHPVRKSLQQGEDPLEFFKETINQLEVEIQNSMRANIGKCLNFLLQTSYNFDKYFHNTIDNKQCLQASLVCLRALLSNDLSLILDNTFVPSSKENVTTRLTKYQSQYNSSLKRFSFVTYREILNEGNAKKLQILESFLVAMLYNSELVGEILKKQEFQCTSFLWQSTLKVCLKYYRDKQTDDISKQNYLESFLKTISHTFRDFDGFPNLLSLAYGGRQIQQAGFELSVTVFDKSLEYGYQFVRNPERLTILPTSEKPAVSLMLSLADGLKTSIKGGAGSGKTSTCLHLAQLCGRHLTILDTSASSNPAFLLQNTIISASAGSWLVIKRLEDATLPMIQALAKIAILLKKQQELGFDSQQRRACQLEKIDFSLHLGFRLVLSQNWDFMQKGQFGSYTPILMTEFRCCTLLSLDLFTFIHASILDLAHLEDFELRSVDSLARSLTLFFQLLQRGLCDKTFMVHSSNAEVEFSNESLMLTEDTWQLSISSIRPILSSLKHLLKSEGSSRSQNGVFICAYKAVYQNLKYQLTPLQKNAMMLLFISVFDPSQELFSVNDSNYDEEAVTLHSFFTTNKLPSFSNLTTIEKLHALVDNWSPSAPLILLNYGENLEAYSEIFSKISLFLLGRKLDTTLATGNGYFTQATCST